MGENRGPQIAGTAAAFLILSWICVLLRCYCRTAIVKSFGLDDWLSVVALFFFTFYCSFSITATFYGSGKPTADISPEDLPIGLKWWWACEPVYVLSGMTVKLSIGLFLLRICVLQSQKYFIYAVETLMCSVSVAYFFVFVFQCSPSSYFWTRYLGDDGSCMDTAVVVDMSYAYSSVICAVDWSLGSLPVFLVWNLQMDFRTKASVAIILAFGAVASTATIIRMPSISALSDTADFLYAATNVAIWSTIETGIAISASACATLRPLFRDFFGAVTNIRSTKARSGNWAGAASRAGYLRNDGNDFNGLNLRGNSHRDAILTTTIKAGSADDDGIAFNHLGSLKKHRSEGKKYNTINGNWADHGRDNAEWRGGITKTMEFDTNSTNEMV